MFSARVRVRKHGPRTRVVCTGYGPRWKKTLYDNAFSNTLSTLPVFTTRVYGPWTRLSKMTPVFTVRKHGPWTRLVCTGLRCYLLLLLNLCLPVFVAGQWISRVQVCLIRPLLLSMWHNLVLDLVSIFSERELKFMFAICHRRSVCRLSVVCSLSSVTFVRSTQTIEIFSNVSTPQGTLAICWHPGKILRRSSKGNPSVGGVKHKRGSRI